VSSGPLCCALQVRPLSVDLATGSGAKGGAPSVVAPRGSTPLSAKVLDGGKPVPNAEVTFIAVDEAILDMLPYDLQVSVRSSLPSEGGRQIDPVG